jgi:hypothetical protein
MYRLHAGRRDEHRQRDLLSHHGCREIALLDRADGVRREAELIECVDVATDGQPLLAAGDQRAVDGFGEALLRPLLRDGDRLEPGIACHVFDQTFVAGFWAIGSGHHIMALSAEMPMVRSCGCVTAV